MIIRSLTGTTLNVPKVIDGKRQDFAITPEGVEVPDELGETLLKNAPGRYALIDDIKADEIVKHPYEDETEYPTETLRELAISLGSKQPPNTGRAKLIEYILKHDSKSTVDNIADKAES